MCVFELQIARITTLEREKVGVAVAAIWAFHPAPATNFRILNHFLLLYITGLIV